MNLPEPVATLGSDGQPRHIRHVWGVRENRLYGPPVGLYTPGQVEAAVAAAVAKEREHYEGAIHVALDAMELHATSYPHMVKGYTIDGIDALRNVLGATPTEPKP